MVMAGGRLLCKYMLKANLQEKNNNKNCVCVCKKIIILIIKRGNGGWVGNVCTKVFSLLGCCYLSRITLKKISGGKGMGIVTSM